MTIVIRQARIVNRLLVTDSALCYPVMTILLQRSEKNVIFAGIVGAGLVWGWLLVLFVDQRSVRTRTQREPEAEETPSKLVQFLKQFLQTWQVERRPYLNLLAVAIFTIWFAWLIHAFTGTTQLIFFFIALIIAFSIHFAWRQQLRQRKKRT